MSSLAPYVPSSEEMVKRMLQMAKLREGEVVYDLGSGDGRILIAAARDFGAKTVGIEIREDLVKETQEKIQDLNLGDRIRVIHGDAMQVDLSDADVITLYLTDCGNESFELIEKLKPKLEKNVKTGARIISNSFRIPGWEPVEILDATSTCLTAPRCMYVDLGVCEGGYNYKIYLYVKK